MKKEEKKKIGIGAGLTLGLVVISLMFVNSAFVNDIGIFKEKLQPEPEVEEERIWQRIGGYNDPLGENDPGAGTGGFMSIFWLDYEEDPATVLANNATDWSASGDVHAYEDTDGTTTDTVSEDPSYIVVRACFTQDQAMSDGNWNGSRTRCTLTCSGDETISQVIWGNGTAETYGGGIESDNDSDFDKLYINFYFDDDSDGYRILDDGSIDWAVTLEAKH